MQLEGMWLPRWRSETEAHLHFVKRVLFSEKSKFQQIDIVELVGYGKCLLLDGIHQFAQTDEFIYQEAIVHPPLCMHPQPRNVLIIGAGGGNAVREVVKHSDIQSVIVVDIDELVVQKCTELIGSDQGAYNDPRVQLIIDDGAKFIQRTNQKFDCILVDSTTPKPESIAYDLYGQTFYKQAWEKLNDGGMLCGFQSNANILFLDSHRTIRNSLGGIFNQVLSYMVYCPFYAISYLLTISIKNAALDPLNVNKYQSRINAIKTKTRFYDEQAHLHIFNLPKYIREFIYSNQSDVDRESLIRY